MDNKEVINSLKFVMDYYKDLDNYTINQLRNLTLSLSSDEIEALDRAIKSLEAWDRVIDELEEYKIIGSQMECFGTTEENAKEYIPIDTALEIINKHLGGE